MIKMDQKIPTTLWKTQLLKLVSEAPRAVCVDCFDDWSHDEICSRPLVLMMSSSSGSSASTSTVSSENIINQSIHLNTNSSDEKITTHEIGNQNNNNNWEGRSCLMEEINEENPFGKAFHGYLSPIQTNQLLKKDGYFLIRKKEAGDDDFILSLRFCGQVKNFLISCDERTGYFYVGEKEKSYSTLQELVQEGLITFYLDQKAGSYIDLMVDLTRFHKFNTISQPQTPTPTPPPPPLLNLNPRDISNGSNQSINIYNNLHNSGYSTNESGKIRKNSQSPTPTIPSKSSVERRRTFDLKSHSFNIHTFQGLSTCGICGNFLWGLSSQGLQCKDCKLNIHEGCVDKVFMDCEPKIELVNKIFGEDLTLIVKIGKGQPPFVLEKCIKEIEGRGLGIEGIYRVSGSKELIERLKNLLENERNLADLSSHLDIHSICCVVKLYLRLLPQPLITSEVFNKFLTAKSILNIDMCKRYIRKLPLSHQLTLKYILSHLHKVSSNSERNKMTPFNLSSVFTPSVICPKEISLNTLKIGTNLLEYLITNVPIIYHNIK